MLDNINTNCVVCTSKCTGNVRIIDTPKAFFTFILVLGVIFSANYSGSLWAANLEQAQLTNYNATSNINSATPSVPLVLAGNVDGGILLYCTNDAECHDPNRTVAYDNSFTKRGYWFPGRAGHELLDYGITSGGQVTQFQFAYTTTLANPGRLTIKFYSGTSGSFAPGLLLKGWTISNLQGSSSGKEETFVYNFIFPDPNEGFEVPAGAFGYSYKFDCNDVGPVMASGGNGNENFFWQDGHKVFKYSPDPNDPNDPEAWAGLYMRLYTSKPPAEPAQIRISPVTLNFDFSNVDDPNAPRDPNDPNDPNNPNVPTDPHKLAGDAIGNMADGADYTKSLFDLSSSDRNKAGPSSVEAGPGLNVDTNNAGGIGVGLVLSPSSHYFAKLQDAAVLQQRFKNGQKKVKVIVNLKATARLKMLSAYIVSPGIYGCSFENESKHSGSNGSSDSTGNAGGGRTSKARAVSNFNKREDINDKGARNYQRKLFLNKLRIREQKLAALNKTVLRMQNAVLNGLSAQNYQLRYRFRNQAGFSAEVNRTALLRLLQNPMVESIEPVYTLKPQLRQGLAVMHAMTYRSEFDGRGIAIAICDTGIDYNHPRLGGGGFPNKKVIGGYDFGDRDADPHPNGHPHGTACAGIAAGDLGNTGDYIGGVAPAAKLYALKISYGGSGSASSDAMVRAWDWCVSHQYDDPNNPIMVISTSFGGLRNYSVCDNTISAMTEAANNANKAGITVLAASGNNGWCDSMAWPACISSVISVGAVYDNSFGMYYPCVDAHSCAVKKYNVYCYSQYYASDLTAIDKVTSYSNVPDFLDILAPSNQTYTTDIAGPGGYTKGDYTATFGGTSAACPYAAGAVACLQSAAREIKGRYISPYEVKQALIATGNYITDDKSGIIKPRINLEKAIERLMCNGKFFSIYNDGKGPLEVTSITPQKDSTWLYVQSELPITVEPGGRRDVCVELNYTACDTCDKLLVVSNDPNTCVYPDGVYVHVSRRLGDMTGDCQIDITDLSLMMRNWLKTAAPGKLPEDLDYNGIVDLYDFSILTSRWLTLP